jgi:hypothetical protein
MDLTRFYCTRTDLILGGLILLFVMMLLCSGVLSLRESSRGSQCGENLRKIGQAVLAHEQAQKFFPTGGWGYRWYGDPDCGFDVKQPGGWCFNVLPYLDHREIHDMSLGRKGSDKLRASVKMVATPVPEFICTSRRPMKAYPSTHDFNNGEYFKDAAKTDYAIIHGDSSPDFSSGPASITDVKYKWPDTSSVTGISFVGSMVQAKEIKRGLSNMYMVGEKYLVSRNYFNGQDSTDDASLYHGHDSDIARIVSRDPGHICPPGCDSDAESSDFLSFGSAHPTTWNMVFCDGSLRSLSYDIDLELHRALGNRNNEEKVDVGQLGPAR